VADKTERASYVAHAPVHAVTGYVLEGPDEGFHFPLGRNPVALGKAADCPLRLSDPLVSGRHVELSVEGAAIRVKDLGSTNGTWIGPNRIGDSLVPVGTVLVIGKTRIHLRGRDLNEVRPSAATAFGELVGRSIAMRQLYGVLERVAKTDATVFMDGETGTGKELVAKAIHAESGRKRGPFKVLDCSAVVAELISSELFGHVRGAFTGADRDREGLFEAASGGTLFLDELDSLPEALQSNLLRVLESRTITRVGDQRERAVDVRLIAASRRPPEDLVDEGKLRDDLHFRLAVVRLTLPPLRDRLEDLPGLCSALLERAGAGHIAVEEGSALERLRGHPWPGNVRELRNALEGGLALAPTDATRLEDLPLRLRAARSVSGGELHSSLPYKEAKEAVVAGWEGRYLAQAFDAHGGNLSRTAEALGLSRMHLRTLLTRHGLKG
jgi:DNA-binding NtrC family response regulator